MVFDRYAESPPSRSTYRAGGNVVMGEVVIRVGETQDVAAAVATWRRSSTARRGGQAPTAEREAQVRSHLREPGVLLMLTEDAGDIVGMAAGVPGLANDGAGPPEPGLFFLSLVYVAPDRWSEGIGGRLVDAVLDAARCEGYDRVHLWTHRDNNDRAQRLYEGRGFHRSGVEKNDEAGDRIIRYERHLTDAEDATR